MMMLTVAFHNFVNASNNPTVQLMM